MMSKKSAMTDKSRDRIGLSRNGPLTDGHKNLPSKAGLDTSGTIIII